MEWTKYQKDYRIPSYEIDLSEELKLVSILQLIQEVSEEHAASFHLGRRGCLQHGLVWVIARVEVIINQLPKLGDTVTIETWPGKVKKIIYPRYVTFEDETNQVQIKAVTAWSLFDINRRSLSFINPALLDYPDTSKVLEYLPLPSRLDINEFDQTFIRKPVFSDLDCNHHVNNVKYVEWLLNYLPINYLANKEIKYFKADYFHEIMATDEVEVRMKSDETRTMAQFVVNGIVSANCLIKFKEKCK